MSNKEHEKLDGVFDNSPGAKGEKGEKAAKGEKPARPPKLKTSLSRETKVGLAVIAALLVIFVIVLVVRLRGDSGKEIAKGNDPSAGAADAEKPKNERQKAMPAASRTLIAEQSGAANQPRYLFDNSGDTKNGSGTGSAYESATSGSGNSQVSDQGAPRGGYLPASAGQGAPASGVANKLQTDADVDTKRDNALRLDQSNVQDRGAPGHAGSSALSPGAGNPFPSRITLGNEAANAVQNNQSIASDEGDAEDEVATPTGAGSIHAFDNQKTKALDHELIGASSNADIERRGVPQTKSASAAGGFAGAKEQAMASDDELGEADKFNPNPMRSIAGASRLAGNNLGAQKDDTGKESIDADQESGVGNLKPLERVEFPHGQQNLANSPKHLPTKGKSPFSAPSWSAAEPAPLDEAALGANGESPAPLAGEPPSDQGAVHVVAADDTYWTIAKKTYGSGAYFKALYEHNRRRLNNADALRPGTQLNLPDEATLQRLYPTLCPRPQRLAASARATRASFNSPTGGQEYVVSDGDTLYDVARRRLGNASRWAEVYELNRDAIGAATERLEPGTRLVLPTKE